MIDAEAPSGYVKPGEPFPKAQGFSRSRGESQKQRKKTKVLFTEQVVNSDHSVRTAD